MLNIAPEDLRIRIVDAFLNRWMLLTSGDFAQRDFNTMTVAWGFLGAMWKKPVAIAVVRPTRYTYEFMNRYDTFTLCAFPEEHRSDLSVLGTRSGREGDKIAETSLTAVASERVAAPCFAQAELVVECRKIYADDIVPEKMIDPAIDANYPAKDYHRAYYGEILAVRGTDAYR